MYETETSHDIDSLRLRKACDPEAANKVSHRSTEYTVFPTVITVLQKPVGIAGVDEAIDQLIERQKAKSEREEARKRRKAERSWASTTLSEHTMVRNGKTHHDTVFWLCSEVR